MNRIWSVVLVFVASAFVEYLRITFLERKILQTTEKILNRAKAKIKTGYQI